MLLRLGVGKLEETVSWLVFEKALGVAVGDGDGDGGDIVSVATVADAAPLKDAVVVSWDREAVFDWATVLETVVLTDLVAESAALDDLETVTPAVCVPAEQLELLLRRTEELSLGESASDSDSENEGKDMPVRMQ